MSDDSWFFAGRNAVVTGGASGIGRAVVTQLVRLGATVYSYDVADQDDGPTKWFRPERVDLTDGAAVDAAFAAIGGKVDFLVNVAGVSPLHQTLEQVVAVDFLAVRRTCRLALASMDEGSAIVNVASVAGIYPSMDEPALALLDEPDDERALAVAAEKIPNAGIGYAVAKRAVILLTMRLAAEVAPRRIRVNSTSPHAAATPMHYAIKRDDPAMYEHAKMTATFGRWSSPDEQADVVTWMLGPRSTYVSGQNLMVDGGWWAAMQTSAPELRQM